jgi:hypothetical protein
VLFTLAGVVAGVEASWYGQHFHPGWFGWLGGYRYHFAEAVRLPPGSDAHLLAAQIRVNHPGLQVVISPRRFRGPRRIVISATGIIHEGLAVTKAARQVVALTDGRGKRIVFHGVDDGALAGDPVEDGLLAGAGTALGLIVPSRRRVPV